MTTENPVVAAGDDPGFLFDARLSLEARGALQLALHHPGPLGPTELARAGSISRGKTYTILNELIDYGYCERVTVRDGGSFRGVTYQFRPCIDLPYTVAPYPSLLLYYSKVYDLFNNRGVRTDTVEPHTVEPHTVNQEMVADPSLAPTSPPDPLPDPLPDGTHQAEESDQPPPPAVTMRVVSVEPGFAANVERTAVSTRELIAEVLNPPAGACRNGVANGCGSSKSNGKPDPLLGMTTPQQWFGRHRTPQAKLWANAGDEGLDAETMRVLVDTLAAVHGSTRLINDAENEDELLRMQEIALGLFRMCKKAGMAAKVAPLVDLFAQQWREDRGEKDYPWGKTQFLQFASRKFDNLVERLESGQGVEKAKPVANRKAEREVSAADRKLTIDQLRAQRTRELRDFNDTAIPDGTDEEIWQWLQMQKNS